MGTNAQRGPGRVLLSGASGLLGTAIADSTRRSGAEVLQLVRRPPAGPGEVQWDPGAAEVVAGGDRQALDGLTAAIHLSGANVAAQRWTPAYRRDMWSSRVESTRRLCEMLAGMPRKPAVVLAASATGIYGNRGNELLDEDSSAGDGFLADLCRAWEEATAPAEQAGIRVVHLRFGVVLARAGALAKMLPVFRKGLGGRIGSGRQWMSWIALTDAVAAVRFLMDHQEISGPINVTSPTPVTNAQFTTLLAHQVHRPALFPVPAFALRLAFGQMADEALLASARVIPSRLLAAGFQFTHPRLDSALAAALA